MKKKITQLRWLATMLMLVAAMVMPSTAWAQESTVTFTAKEGTAGFSDNESFDKLIDGKFTSDDFTKWCLTFPSDGAYIIFCASEPILVSGYSIVTGNDNAKEKARNPKSWALYGCNDESAGRNSDSWVLIDQKVEDTDLQDVNYQKYDFTLSNLSSEKYQYFKMEITATKGSSVLQMSELILTYTTCNHQWVKTGDVVDPTCTEGGYDVCKCSLCQLTKNEANDNGALGHQWVDGDVVPPTCTTDGYTPQTCSRCHAEQIINIVNATGHQWGNDDVCDVCQINNTVLNIPQGDGTLANPYKISTVGELYWFAGLVNGDASVCNDVVNQNTAACAKLMNDIVVNYDDDFSNHNWNSISRSNWFFWTPIGKQEFNIYTGTFDGQGHTISGLYFESCSNYYDQKSKEYDDQNRDYLSFGLFGFNGGTIKNVGVINSYFGWQYNYIGGVCGVNYRTIENCYNEGKVEGKGNDTGGICARNFGTITNCYNLGTVIGEYGTGGVCGVNFETIKNCYYLSSTATGGINGADVEGSAESKTADQFKNGEVAWLLNGGKTDGSQAWYQNLSAEGGDIHPVLTKTNSNTVYQVRLLCGGVKAVGKTYANSNKDVTIAHELPETTSFNSEKTIYDKVCQREGCGKTLYYADADCTIEATPNADETAFAVAPYTLADATEYNSKAEFTVTSLAYKRKFYDDKWMAVYVPFAIDCSKLESDYEMATINNFHEYEQEDGTYNVVLEVKRVTKGGTIPALTPCLIRMKTAPAEEVEKTLTFENAAFSAATDKSIDCSSVTRYYQFSGTLNGKTGLTAGTDFVLNAGKLYNTSESTVLLPQRWYLSATDRTSTPVEPAAMLRSISIKVIGDGEATGIEDIHVNTELGADASGSTGIYDLQGRKINSEPTKGMYIKNGKKYIK